jgi:drug/metabolite transporter (DMT)-like permease
MNIAQYRPLVVIHGAVLLFAFSGLFAKWLSLPAEVIVFGRTLFAGLFLLLIISIWQPKALIIKREHIKNFLLTGALLGLHWVTFFLSIQLSTVGFGLLAFATFPLFTSIIERCINKSALNKKHLLLSLLVIIGVVLIFPQEGSFKASIVALITGLLSALTFALLLVFNRKLVIQYPFYSVACYQNLIASILLLPLCSLSLSTVSVSEWSLLMLLGIVFTACAHSLLNYALQSINAFKASVAISLEPVYGIIAAGLLLSEPITYVMAIGAGLMISVNFYLVVTES